MSVPGLSDAEAAWERVLEIELEIAAERHTLAGFRLLAEALGAQLAEHEPTAGGPVAPEPVADAPTGKQPSCPVSFLDDYRPDRRNT